MSQPEYPEVDEIEFENYKQWCRANNLYPTLSDYSVWLADQDKDSEEW